MRVSTRGNIADRCYYDGSSTHEYQEPYLSVNRRTNMASLLSEAGFHTIAEQQSRNLNDDYKKLEAVAAGLADASGNATDEMKFRFLTEYRSCLNAETVLPLDGVDDNGLVDVYNLQGIMVRSQVPSNEATQGLPAGIYIAGHRKVIVK